MTYRSIHLAVAALVLASASAMASSNRLIPFQAELQGSEVVPNGSHTLVFAIYDAPVNGTALWEEIHSDVAVDGGRVNVFLGSTRSLDDPDGDGDESDAVPFSERPLYLGVRVGSESSQEMLPRHQLVPAFHAASASSATHAATADVSLGVPEGAISAGNMVDGAITEQKLATDAVSEEKIATGAVRLEHLHPEVASGLVPAAAPSSYVNVANGSPIGGGTSNNPVAVNIASNLPLPLDGPVAGSSFRVQGVVRLQTNEAVSFNACTIHLRNGGATQWSTAVHFPAYPWSQVVVPITARISPTNEAHTTLTMHVGCEKPTLVHQVTLDIEAVR